MHKILVISAGPGGKEYMTDLARTKVKECEVIIGSAEQLEAVEVLDDQIVHEEWGVENIMNIVQKHEGKKVGVLVVGDAGVYSLAQRFAERFGRDAIEEVIPGVSSIQVAFARIKEPWLNMQVFSYRKKTTDDIDEVLAYERSVILCDREHNSKMILSALRDAGLFKQKRRVYVFQDLTFDTESVIKIEKPADIEGIDVKRREIVLTIKDKAQ